MSFKSNSNPPAADHDRSELHQQAIRFFIEEEVITFGDFKLKSGRSSPYFFNTGSLCDGRQLSTMGDLYARLIASVPEFNDASVIFGSAYKGIPISVATAIGFAALERGALRAVSDRKEAKTHGDASSFLGVLKAGDRAVIVDDVISTGETKIEAIGRLREAGCEPMGLVIAFDRCEPVDGRGMTAREILEAETGLPVHALSSVQDIIAVHPTWEARIKAHLDSYKA